MPRQSISLTQQNDLWLRSQVENVGDYTNKSELVNDLIRHARRAEAINTKLQQAEMEGFTEQSPQEILTDYSTEK
jgi:antitoxin ParD1/3/4